MFRNLWLKNLRLFGELEIDQLERINILAGRNNSGKTSVLEAILLLAGANDAQLLLDLPQLRGVSLASKELAHSFWRPMFAELDTRKEIEIKGSHSLLGDLAVTIARKDRTKFARQGIEHFENRWQSHETRGKSQGTPLLSTSDDLGEGWDLEFSLRANGATECRNMRMASDGHQIFYSGPGIPLKAAIISANIGNVRDDAVLLGKLRARKQGSVLSEALRVIEPRLESVEDSSASGTPMIWADIGLPELAPLSAVGEGMTRIARVVLAMSSVPEGLVLVDEIEAGIHHSVMGKLWEVVAKAAKAFDVQVFATTHSFECLEAAYGALADEWRFHRLERSADGICRCVTFDTEDVETVVKHGLEVR